MAAELCSPGTNADVKNDVEDNNKVWVEVRPLEPLLIIGPGPKFILSPMLLPMPLLCARFGRLFLC
jgi:hypothetical protein